MATLEQREAVAMALRDQEQGRCTWDGEPRPYLDRADEIIAAYEAAAPTRFCPYPVIAGMSRCCGNKPCTLEWSRPCDATGGCLDRATCGGCDEPVFPYEAAAPARPLQDWHEEIGPALWWAFPVQEPPYSGTPLDDDWPGYHTHFTEIVVPEDPTP